MRKTTYFVPVALLLVLGGSACTTPKPKKEPQSAVNKADTDREAADRKTLEEKAHAQRAAEEAAKKATEAAAATDSANIQESSKQVFKNAAREALQTINFAFDSSDIRDSETRLSTISYGKERAIVCGKDEPSWAFNRRCEFKHQIEEALTAQGVAPGDITTAQAADLLKNPAAYPGLILLDIRTPQEIAESYIDGARFIDFKRDDFMERVAALPKEAPILLYCRGGGRTAAAMALMNQQGFKQVYNMLGGIMAWQNEGRALHLTKKAEKSDACCSE